MPKETIFERLYKEYQNNKKTVIVIDTDAGFLDRFDKKLLDQFLKTEYQIYPYPPDTTLAPDEIVNESLNEVQKLLDDGVEIWAILVDIVLIEKGPLDDTGVIIAKRIKATFPEIPVFNITSKFESDAETALVSETTTENIDGVLFKQYLESKYCSAQSLIKLFGKTADKFSQVRVSRATQFKVPSWIRESYNPDALDPRVKSQIAEIGESRFWSLFAKLLPKSQGTISFMQPGRSGANVFKIKAKFKEERKSATRSKGWIIKVADDKNLLEAEANNYSELIKCPVDRSTYPKLLTPQPLTVGTLTGIVLELEEDSNSLIDLFAKLGTKEMQLVIHQLSKALRGMYGDSAPEQSFIWRSFYKFKEDAINSVQSFLKDNEQIIRQKLNEDYFNSILTFIKEGVTDKRIDAILNAQGEVDTRNIHGDLNCRNILINKSGNLVLIDFSARGQNHIAKDIAKLERDLIFKVFDVFTTDYYDWSRLDTWEYLLQLIETKESIFGTHDSQLIEDQKLRKCVEFIVGIRQILKHISPALDEREYLMALLHYSLLAIIHPEISIQKKVFAIKYINKLLDYFRQ